MTRKRPAALPTRRDVMRDGAALLTAVAGGLLAACGRAREPAAAGSPLRDGAPPGRDVWQQAADIADAIAVPAIPDRSADISAYGAQPGWGSDSRPAIQAAVDALARAGGGRVEVPAGQWFSDGPIRLASRIELHLQAGAHLRFSGTAASYLPVVKTRWEGTEVWTYSPMIFTDGAEDVAITGTGKLDGQGERNFLPWRQKQKPDQNRLRQMGIDGVPVDDRVFGEGHWLRPHFVQFRDCRRVLIDGPTFVDSPFWVNHLLYCDQVTVRNIRVVSHHINSDGVDVDSSSNVLIERSEFDVGDDGVAIKSGRDQDGWRVARPSRNVIIRDCRYLGQTGGAMAIGSEMSGGVTDVFVDGYRMAEAHHALYFKANLDRGGKIERVHIRRIRVGAADSLLIFTNDYHSYRGGDFPARFENVTVDDVHCDTARVGLSIVGHARAPVRNVTLRKLTIGSAEVPMQVSHAEGLVFEDVSINGAAVAAPPATGAARTDVPLKH